MKINIKTKLPGPKAKKIIERDAMFVSPSYTRDPTCPLVIAKGEGAYVTDVDGNTFLDFCAGIATTSTGHSHPKVVDAISKQAKEFIHMSGTDFYYDVQSSLAQKLSELAPGKENKKVFLSNSGAEAIECALKLARYATKRKQFIAFLGAFHGRTYGALSLTASKAVHKENFFPFLPGVTHIPYPNTYKYGIEIHPHLSPLPSRERKMKTEEECSEECLNYITEKVFKHIVPPQEVAAIFIEPIQGEGGYIVPPVQFMKGLADLCKKNGILLVADEVQSGMGRTGKMFASSHFGIEPDIICLAKGIASGMPLGATIARGSIMNWKPGSHASTFGGNPVSCAAALATIELIEKELVQNAKNQGDYLLSQLKKMQKKYSAIVDVRGLGLMIGIEIASPELKNKTVTEAFKKGLIILGCGTSTIRFSPPLMVTKKECDVALSIFEDTIHTCGS